jgi:hypothetical protein
MFGQATLDPWRWTIMTYLPHLSKSQAIDESRRISRICVTAGHRGKNTLKMLLAPYSVLGCGYVRTKQGKG